MRTIFFSKRLQFQSQQRTNPATYKASNVQIADFYYRFPHGGPESHDVQRRDIDDIRYDREDPCTGIKQILTGFTKWTLRYISQCSGQRDNSYQVRRMAKWHKT